MKNRTITGPSPKNITFRTLSPFFLPHHLPFSLFLFFRPSACRADAQLFVNFRSARILPPVLCIPTPSLFLFSIHSAQLALLIRTQLVPFLISLHIFQVTACSFFDFSSCFNSSRKFKPFAVNRYACSGLLGESGLIIQTYPLAIAGCK